MGTACSLRDADQPQLRLCHFVCLPEAWTLSGRDALAALEIREMGVFVQGFERLCFFFSLCVRLPGAGLGSRCGFISSVSSRLSAHSGYQLK